MAYAHTTDGPQETWQPLEEHLTAVSRIAAKNAGKFGASAWGELTGLLHDLGKYTQAFQDKLTVAPNNRAGHKGEGAKFVYETFGLNALPITYSIAGHHKGLPDYEQTGMGNGASLKSLIENALPIPEAGQIFAAGKALPAPPQGIKSPFQAAFFTRMLFSSLVDADFLDTERFLEKEKSSHRLSPVTLPDLLPRLNVKLAGFTASTPINTLRAEILHACADAASHPSGLFTLTVPTGGGKTLSSMKFALEHAKRYGMERIIYVIPFTSIIEQTAQEFRKIFPKGTVVEHHSNFDERIFRKNEPASHGKAKNSEDEEISTNWHTLTCENWNAPVVVTTNVQFFESLYAAKPSRCRKLHNMAKSVIILDEAQMLPVNYLLPCLEALKELTVNYGSSVVLCTATQPALRKQDDFKKGIEAKEIAPDPKRMHAAFKRTELINLGTQSLTDIAQRMQNEKQVITVVNSRFKASKLFALLQEEKGAYHLSALMCPAHRSEVLEEIRQKLAQKLPCRVVSTSLIEAGIDISAPVVIREMAGLDSITQAAGRCNREGELQGLGKVYTYLAEEGDVKHFRKAIASTQSTLRGYDDAFSPEAIRHFFMEYFWLNDDRLDEKKILSAHNAPRWQFSQIAKDFRLIENDMLPIIVPYNDEAIRLMEALRYTQYTGSILRKLQQYTVQVYKNQHNLLNECGCIDILHDRYSLLLEENYTSQQGIRLPEDIFVPENFLV